MQEQHAAVYRPLATARTKRVVRNLAPGGYHTIDLINVAPPHDRKQVDAWAEDGASGMQLLYCEGGRCPAIEITSEEQMRIEVECAASDIERCD
jgi:hypothetical protein